MSTKINEEIKENIRRAIELCGGVTKLSKELELSNSAVRHFYNRGVPAEYVMKICKLSGFEIRPIDLRPDVFEGADRLPRRRKQASKIYQ